MKCYTGNVMTWDVIITEWALDSYLRLRKANVFTEAEYRSTFRPDAEMLRDGIPSPHPKFSNAKFWGPATFKGQSLPNGYKMKWHQVGPGKAQLRLPVMAGAHHGAPAAFLCECYVKSDAKHEQIKIARFKTHMNLIHVGKYQYRGSL